MNKHIVLLTKPYDIKEWAHWYAYHKAMGWIIHVIANLDGEADTECKQAMEKKIQPGLDIWYGQAVNAYSSIPVHNSQYDTFEVLYGWPDQWNLFNKILNTNKYGFREGDLVTFIDDDEYLWFYADFWKLAEAGTPEADGKHYETLAEYMKKNNPHKKPLLVPQILMSDKTLPDYDFSVKSAVSTKFYARNDQSSQGKAIIIFDPNVTYDFTFKSGEEMGHVPAINGVRDSLVNMVGESFTTYGALDPNACVRLYHYHLKSKSDYLKKWRRGSVSHPQQWKPEDVTKNLAYGNYTRLDMTMQNTCALLGLEIRR